MEKVVVSESGSRLDRYLAFNTSYSRSRIVKLIDDGIILVNGRCEKASYKVEENDIIEIHDFEEEVMSATAEKMDLDIVYEDEDVMVVNKANGVVVHPAIGNNHGTLVNGLLYHSSSLSNVNGEFRPGIVHRIDAYTTGLLMIAKNNKAHEVLAQELSEKKTTRKYVALVWGVILNDTGLIHAPIGRDPLDRKKMCVTDKNSKDAITHFKVLERFKKATLIELKLETGRTHQIRVHMNYIGYPVVNDPVYGKRKILNEEGQMLHAKTLGFIHPTTQKYMEFDSELPSKMTKIIELFRNDEI